MPHDLSPIETVVLYRPESGAGRRAMEVALTQLFARKALETIPAQRWQPAFPRDGILDARHEGFDIRLEADAAGRTLVSAGGTKGRPGEVCFWELGVARR